MFKHTYITKILQSKLFLTQNREMALRYRQVKRQKLEH